MATPSIPGVPDCKDAPVAEQPDRGVSGMLDPAPDPVPPAGDPFASSRTTSIYDQYGYAGLRWNTYDLGCGGSVRDPEASADTMVGNLAMSGAVFVTSLSNGIHNAVSKPQDYMGPLDRVVDRVSSRMHDAIWTPWGAVALLGVVALLLTYSMRGQMSSVVSGGLWALLVLAIVSGLGAYPSRAASFFDDTVTRTIGALQVGSAGLVAGDDLADPGRSQGALAVDTVLYEGWLRGELGSSDSPAADKWGPQLFKATAFTRSEAAESRDPNRAQEISEEKAEAFTTLADEIKEEDPSTYAVLQGKAGGRAGTGLLTFIGSLFTVGFRVIADAFLVAGLVMLRLLVMFFPAAAVVGVLAPLSSIVRRIGNIGAASLVNVVAFSAGSVIHTAAVSALLSSGQGAGMSVMVLLLCLVLTVAALVLMLPFLSMTRMLGGQSRHGVMRSVRRNAIRYAVNRKATEDGTNDVIDEQRERRSQPDGDPGSRVSDPTRSESFRRPSPVWDVTSDGVRWRDSSSDDSPQPVLLTSARRPGARSDPDPSPSWPDAPRGPNEPRPQPGPQGSPSERVLVGRLVADEANSDRKLGLVREHDGDTERRHDGSFGHEIYDPGTGRDADREAS
ncbi:hypothetical protein [Knoellia sinensis]|nr:hypothetical protein [Knoellia sinensis]